jgi:hypothetical protein
VARVVSLAPAVVLVVAFPIPVVPVLPVLVVPLPLVSLVMNDSLIGLNLANAVR